jgi:iron complex transport system ATP-binding protein
VGLLNRKNELVDNLSGGEMQILRIARVLAQDTRVILFDEPTSNLDLKNAHQVSSLIKKLNSHGIQTIVTSHDFRILKDISDFLCLLKDGVLIDSGQIKDVLTYQNIINAFELSPEHYSKIDSDEFKNL